MANKTVHFRAGERGGLPDGEEDFPLAFGNLPVQEENRPEHGFGQIIGRSKALKQVLQQAQQAAPTDTTILLLGETGTGKELLAEAIHSISLRRSLPLTKVSCATLLPTLIESELFGHEKGAFTGANV